MSVAFFPLLLGLVVLGAVYGQEPLRPPLMVEIKFDVEANAGPHFDWGKRFTLYRGDRVRVLERTRNSEPGERSRVDAWLRVSRGNLEGWIPAHAVYIDADQLQALRLAQIPPYTVTANGAATARAAPDVSSRALFVVPRGQVLNVVGRSDDSEWIAVSNPDFDFYTDGPHRRSGWLRTSLLTLSRGQPDDLPQYLPDGLVVASVIGTPVSVRLAEVARWDTWAWNSSAPSIWFHRLTEDSTEEVWSAPRRISAARLWNGDELSMYLSDYDLSGNVLPAPVGGSLLVRRFGSADDPSAPVTILEPDGRTYSLGQQWALNQSDSPRPLSLDAVWSPDGRDVLLYHTQTRGRAMILYDRNGEVVHLGIGDRAAFHPDSASLYYLSNSKIQRVDLQGRPDRDFRPIPTATGHGFQLSADGKYIISLNETHGLVATLTTSDSRFVRSWRVDSTPQISSDGARALYANDGNLWAQDLDDGELRKIGPLHAERHAFSWSPDGSKIAFESPEGLRIAPSSGRSAAAKLIIHGHQPRTSYWSPDSRWLAVETLNVRLSPALPTPDLQLTEDGLAWEWASAQIRVYQSNGRLHRIWRVNSGCRDIAWSPDSEWIAYGGPSGCA